MNGSRDCELSKTDEELLELCKHQDQEALHVLFRRHERPVYSLLLKMLSNKEDAEDALADVFVKVWKSANAFKGNSKFTTWLFRIATNTARDFLRSRRVRPEVSMEDTILADKNSVGQNVEYADPVKSVIAIDEHANTIKALEKLSEEDRLLITLYHINELEYDEIAEITGNSISNLKVKLFRARQRLRKLCEEQDEDYGNGKVRTDTANTSRLQQGASDCS